MRAGKVFASVVLWAMLLAAPTGAETLRLDVQSAHIDIDAYGRPVLNIILTEGSAHDFAHYTTDRVGTRLDLMIDGETVLSPVIHLPVTGGQVQVTLGDLSTIPPQQMQRLRAGIARVEVRPARSPD
ncbi:MAG: hypothetical protein Q4G14_10675 [Paracoccus sp. (in: a-proteobacteria)]|uniref:SecDF P1 head subdomain-containing protein n=1 Tax=Paracoccus sp. TaxID=267 RepID=UPI0026DF3221|nr:hypothetical protein [Paracoccus sp. (in: a-proteobacteria)]MDO5613688.1 hypothetical protein [Paracoccus sp. (in: a-proteobacteria)]